MLLRAIRKSDARKLARWTRRWLTSNSEVLVHALLWLLECFHKRSDAGHALGNRIAVRSTAIINHVPRE